ncbi:MAG: cyclodeaminase/cyclohydrolase family protein [Tannerellaceae bacterium]|jgi:formiminotetrahydrofolate cyclodeaminase|nr:cyclodeaminase/cyclohydrolase family protein [Tannerellaceae bacterium]
MLTELTIREFLAKTASNAPVPGGGSIAALNGAIALSLTEMVARLTIGKKKYATVEDEMCQLIEKTAPLRERLTTYIDKDSEAYEQVFAAFKLPKETEAEMEIRDRAIEEATRQATLIPLQVAETLMQAGDSIRYVGEYGNRNAASDAQIALQTARCAMDGALRNVRINLPSIKDRAFAEEVCKRMEKCEL